MVAEAGAARPGRRRGIAADVLGLIIAVVVTAASVHDNAIGIALLDKVAATAPTVTKGWVDAGFKQLRCVPTHISSWCCRGVPSGVRLCLGVGNPKYVKT